MRALSLVLLLAACHDSTPTGMDDLPPTSAGDMAMTVDQLSTMDLFGMFAHGSMGVLGCSSAL